MQTKMFFLKIFIALILISLVPFLLYSNARYEYLVARSSVSKVPIGSLLKNQRGLLLDEHWVNPGARLVTRIVSLHYRDLTLIGESLDKMKSPFELWILSGSKFSDALSYFYLSFAAGDLPSSYQILTTAAKQSEVSSVPDYVKNRWIKEVTNVFWQGSLEYLNELDFGRSAIFNNLYLSISHSILGGGDYYTAITAQRNRSLSYILQGEFSSERIKAMCKQIRLEESFGYLLGGEWGYPIPSDEFVGLLERRKDNKEHHCGDPSEYKEINYKVVTELSSGPSLLACQTFPLECDFVRRREDMRNGAQIEMRKALQFATSCSYLSDDMLWAVLIKQPDFNNQEPFDKSEEQGKINFDELGKAINCSDRMRGDYQKSIYYLLEDLPCTAIDASNIVVDRQKIKNLMLEKLASRCGLK